MPQAEWITEKDEVISTLQSLVESRALLYLEIPSARTGWITRLLEIAGVDGPAPLLLDRVRGFESLLTRSPDREILLESRDAAGVPCSFFCRVAECTPAGITAELPRAIRKLQKRANFRVDAPLGAEIHFVTMSGEKGKGILLNFSGSGAAFGLDRACKLQAGDRLQEVRLQLPGEDGPATYAIGAATLRRLDEEGLPGRSRAQGFAAIEFTEIARDAFNRLVQRVFQEQRKALSRVRK